MIKKVFRPFWSYDVQKTEEWLLSMAEKGYFLIRINRGTRCFFFQQGEPKKLTYRIGYDKMQGEVLSKGLLAEGWTKVLRSRNWFVTTNEKPLDQIKTSPVREGIIKHNRVIMYIFLGIFIYLSITVLFNMMMGLIVFFSDVPVEVVDSPFWLITYLFMGIGIVTWILSLYSVIKISKVNKKLSSRKTNQNIDHSKSLSEGRLPKAEEKQLKRSGQMIVKRKLGWMYAPDRLETWLETMELKGLNLYRVSKAGTAFYFIIGQPRHVSYCADYQNIADESYFDIHREAGWKMVFNSLGSLQKWSIWSREYTESESRPQIYSDKSHQIKHAKRIAITYSCLFLPLIIAYIFNIGFRIEIMSLRGLGKIDIIGMIIMLLAIISFGSYSVRTWLYYWRLKKRLDINF